MCRRVEEEWSRLLLLPETRPKYVSRIKTRQGKHNGLHLVKHDPVFEMIKQESMIDLQKKGLCFVH